MSSKPRVQLEQLSHLLSKSMGDEKAMEVVVETCAVLGLNTSDGLSADQALDVLETIAKQPGIVGVTARFAKSRFHFSIL